MSESPNIQTERLWLRKLQLDDLPYLVRFANNRKIADKIVNIRHPYSELDASMRLGYVHKGFVSKTRYCFAIIDKRENHFVGEISLHLIDEKNKVAQLAYWIGEPFWNKGITTEAVASILHFGFLDAGYEIIYADCTIDNKASEQVMIRNHMQKFKASDKQLFYKISKEQYIR
jgi:RimJ/RimL family protein N-acetyltransferase